MKFSESFFHIVRFASGLRTEKPSLNAFFASLAHFDVEFNDAELNLIFFSFAKRENAVASMIVSNKTFFINKLLILFSITYCTIKKIIINNSSNHLVEIADYNFVCEYGFFYVYKKEKGYSYQLDTIEYLDNEYFRLSNKGEKIQQVTVFKQDLPITIRNYQKNDKIELRYGTKKVNRFFIDRKIRKKDRDRWPVMVNKENEVIFVSGIGCDVNHYTTKPNLFVIK